MAYTTIKKPSSYFNTKLYTQNASTNAITGVNFQPDFTWIKNRDSGTKDHRIFDSVRGANKPLKVNGTNAEVTETDTLNSFDTDGFTLGADTQGYGVNDLSGNNTVSWNWLASNTTASNTDGSIASTVSANTTSGFSIVSWTNASDGSATVGHGLNSAPEIIITKKRSTTNDWYTYTTVIDGSYDYLALNTTSAKSNSTRTAPTSSVFTTDMGDTSTAIAYVFHSVKGFSKFGSYVGNGSTDGTFVYTGFKPAFVMGKATAGIENWFMNDNKRLGYNDKNYRLYPNLSNNEATDINMDILSNGFKLNSTNTNSNGSGTTYIYMAFAEEPLVGDNPCTAR